MRRLAFAWRYLFGPPWDTGVAPPELARVVAARPPGRALDLGCGTGTNVRYLAEHGWQATGIDFVPTAIARARRKLRGYRAQLMVSDVTRLGSLRLNGPFDLALDMGCLHSLTADGRRLYANGLAGWMKPGGLYMLYAWKPAPGQDNGLTRADVADLFAPHFTHTGYEEGEGRPSAWHYLERGGDKGNEGNKGQ